MYHFLVFLLHLTSDTLRLLLPLCVSTKDFWEPFIVLFHCRSTYSHDFPFVPQFLSEVEAWCKVCSEGGLPSEMQELELAIHRHQSLYEQVTQAYTEVNLLARCSHSLCGEITKALKALTLN